MQTTKTRDFADTMYLNSFFPTTDTPAQNIN